MVSIPGHIIHGTLTLGLLKGVDDLCESNILFVAGDLCGDRPVLVRFNSVGSGNLE